jgi:SAM-dependent methyltransferase
MHVMPNASLETVPCNLCGSSQHQVVYEAREDVERDPDLVDKFRASGDELLTLPLVRCRNCALLFVNPRFAADAVFDGYANGADPVYVSQMPARERTFTEAIARITKLAPAKGRLLDVGTAAGGFLKAARDAGWDAVGVEPNRWLAQWGRDHYGVAIHAGSLDDAPLEPGSFDVVTLWDVIEHTPDPLRVLRRAHGLLRPGGLLIVNYPDIGSWVARLFGQRWPFLSSVHLYYFTRDTLRRALDCSGFDTVTIRPHYQRLELDYILSRAAIISPGLSSLGRRLASLMWISNREVPYWIGQTFVAARRRVGTGLIGLDMCSGFDVCLCLLDVLT